VFGGISLTLVARGSKQTYLPYTKDASEVSFANKDKNFFNQVIGYLLKTSKIKV
jgi:hypothetical protein